MKRIMFLVAKSLRGRVILAVSSIVFTAGISSLAQEAPPPPPPADGMMMMHGPGAREGMQGEIGEGKVVTGIPLTATILMMREQTLSDGNRINKQTQMTVYRDSQGRVRRDTTMDFGTPATGRVKHNIIMIKDPVAGKRYMLDPVNKTAHVMPMGPKGRGPRGDGPDGPGKNPPMRHEHSAVQEQALGTKTIDGLQAEGRSVTRTIPAGEIGNEKPIDVVTERWFATDLQIPLLVTHTDPMMGSVTTKVTSVSRGEPDASLFQIPSDYKVVTGHPGDPFVVPMHP